jgi:hypothetical protein
MLKEAQRQVDMEKRRNLASRIPLWSGCLALFAVRASEGATPASMTT